MVKVKISIFICIISLFLLSFFNVEAQSVTAKASIDTNNLLIGDQFRLTLEVKSDKKTSITWPQIPDSIGKLTVVSRTKIDTISTDGSFSMKQKLTLTCFDSGYMQIPSITFMYEKQNFTTAFPAQTEPLMIKFSSVPVDTTKDFKDIKPPLDEPMTFDEYLPYILVILLIIGLGLGGYYFWKRFRNKPKEKPKYDPKIPPHILALESLKQLDAEKLWQNGQVKTFYTRLTEILRIYIERRFLIPALELTTDEIIPALSVIVSDAELVHQLRKTLTVADQVKFAKYQALPDENIKSLTIAFEFVNKTMNYEVPDDNNKEENQQ